ncbi:MAG: prephenate dehydratase [Syntrophales bacterium]
MKEKSLDSLRDDLRRKDERIVRLLSERAGISIEIGKLKNARNLEVYDPAQESRIYESLAGMNTEPLPREAVKNIFREILSASRALQAPVIVACLGPEASFTDLAARIHFGESARYMQQATIADVFEEVERGRAAWGVVPLENSSEGSVKPTLDRLISTPLGIRAEIFTRISHSLMSKTEAVEQIRRIYSHPQALAQCRNWLRKNTPGCELLETGSTAAAVRRVLEDPQGAAIGSSAAASLYGLNLLEERIEDQPSNTTRFVVIGRGVSEMTGRDKTSVLFGTPHTPGALYRALEPFAREGINLMRIESYPARDRIWEYLFFVDLEGHTENDTTARCLASLRRNTVFLKVLGSYPAGGPPV